MRGSAVVIMLGIVLLSCALAPALLVHLGFLRRKRIAREAVALAEKPPPPGPHNCAHQKGGYLRCAAPSCPDGVGGKKYKVNVTGLGTQTLVRVRVEGNWIWATERAVNDARQHQP
jgi:hypothetical protein